MAAAALADLTFGLILSSSKDEAAAPPADASSFDKLRMRRMLTAAPKSSSFRRVEASLSGARQPCIP